MSVHSVRAGGPEPPAPSRRGHTEAIRGPTRASTAKSSKSQTQRCVGDRGGGGESTARCAAVHEDRAVGASRREDSRDHGEKAETPEVPPPVVESLYADRRAPSARDPTGHQERQADGHHRGAGREPRPGEPRGASEELRV